MVDSLLSPTPACPSGRRVKRRNPEAASILFCGTLAASLSVTLAFGQEWNRKTETFDNFGIIHLISRRQRYEFNLKWLTTRPPTP